jgi:hypothetical protein
MKSNPRYEDDSRPFQGKRKLTPEEALRQVQLEHVVDEYRTLVMEYLLVRTSLTTNKVTRKAYWILAMLLVFVERKFYFPHYKEQVQFLKIGLSQGVPELPPLNLIDLVDEKEIVAQMRVIRTRLLGLDRNRANPSDLLEEKT